MNKIKFVYNFKFTKLKYISFFIISTIMLLVLIPGCYADETKLNEFIRGKYTGIFKDKSLVIDQNFFYKINYVSCLSKGEIKIIKFQMVT